MIRRNRSSMSYAFALVMVFTALSAQAIDFQLVESSPIDSGGHTHIVCVADLDSDGALEAVVALDSRQSPFRITERDGGLWNLRETVFERMVIAADLDNDTILELISTPDRSNARIRKASGNDTYTQIHEQTYGFFIENFAVGDSNGNGLKELFTARERSPSTVYFLEVTPPATFASLPAVNGDSLNCHVVGTCDSNQNSINEVIFHDYLGSTVSTYVHEEGVRISKIPNFAARAIGDTDGNGKQEILGMAHVDPLTSPMRIFEYVGGSYQEVFSTPEGWIQPMDVDADGRTELVKVDVGGTGNFNVVRIYHRTGSTLMEIWNSDLLLQGSDDAITSVRPIGDTDGDELPEVAVLQGLTLHVMELESPQVPAAGSIALLLSAGGVGFVGLFAMSRIKR